MCRFVSLYCFFVFFVFSITIGFFNRMSGADRSRVELVVFSKSRKHNRTIYNQSETRIQMIDDYCCHGDMPVAWKPVTNKIVRSVNSQTCDSDRKGNLVPRVLSLPWDRDRTLEMMLPNGVSVTKNTTNDDVDRVKTIWNRILMRIQKQNLIFCCNLVISM